MTASLRRTVVVSMAALLVAITLVWAASSGPLGVVGSPATTPVPSARPTAAPVRPGEDQTTQGQDQRVQRSRPLDLAAWLQRAVGLAAVAAGLIVLASVARAVVQRVAAMLPAKQLVLDLEPLPESDPAREAMRGRAEVHREALAGGDVRNAIVACWVRLEETAGEAGVTRRPAETATEFVVRFLHALDVDPRPVAALARLYQEARFSTHELPTDARDRAREALDAIAAELDRTEASWGA